MDNDLHEAFYPGKLIIQYQDKNSKYSIIGTDSRL